MYFCYDHSALTILIHQETVSFIGLKVQFKSTHVVASGYLD